MNEAQIAVLVLDGSGKVTAANQAAKALWQTGVGELVGDFFPGLFALDIVSDEPRMLEAQWDVLLAATLDKGAVLSVQPREGAPQPYGRARGEGDRRRGRVHRRDRAASSSSARTPPSSRTTRPRPCSSSPRRATSDSSTST